MSNTHWEIKIPKSIFQKIKFLAVDLFVKTLIGAPVAFVICVLVMCIYTKGQENQEKKDKEIFGKYIPTPTETPNEFWVGIKKEILDRKQKDEETLRSQNIKVDEIKNKAVSIMDWCKNNKDPVGNTRDDYPDLYSNNFQTRLLALESIKYSVENDPKDIINFLENRKFIENSFNKILTLCSGGFYNKALGLISTDELHMKIETNDRGSEAEVYYLSYKIYQKIQPYVYQRDRNLIKGKVTHHLSLFESWAFSGDRKIEEKLFDLDGDSKHNDKWWHDWYAKQPQWPELATWKSRVDFATLSPTCRDCSKKGEMGWGEVNSDIW